MLTYNFNKRHKWFAIQATVGDDIEKIPSRWYLYNCAPHITAKNVISM